jgi:transposase
MTPEILFHQLLNLGDEWRVCRCEFDAPSGEVNLWIEETPGLWAGESTRSKETVKCYDHVEELEWRHLNIFEHRCTLRCRLPRGRRPNGTTYRVTPPWEGLAKHFTKAFEAMALLLMRHMPMAAVARAIKETDTRLWRIMHSHIEQARKELDWSAVTCVGCDELSIRKGHNYVTIFADVKARHVLFATPGKDMTTWDRFVKELDKHNGHGKAINEVSMDMSLAYQAGARAYLRDDAVIVFDPFHVMKQVGEGVDSVRRLESSQGSPAVVELLKNSRWILLKNKVNLTEKQALQLPALEKSNLHSAKAYQMRLALQDIYRLPTREQADTRLTAWIAWVRDYGLKAESVFGKMVQSASMIESHKTGILQHWVNRTTNAIMEGINSVFSAVKRRARGFRSEENFIAMLYFTAGNLKIPYTVTTH